MDSKYKIEAIKGISERGAYNKDLWLDEAENHIFSSKLLYEHSINSRKKLNTLTAERKKVGKKINQNEYLKLIEEVNSSSKSSLLLLGYSIELYIKAGLVRLHQNTAREDFDKLLRCRYGHNLKESSKLLGFDLTVDEERMLDRIKKLILDEARYPVTPISPEEYSSQVNRVNSEVWSETIHSEWSQLAEIIKMRVQSIDSDLNNPASFWRYNINEDGYCALRFGGNLPPYLLVRYSSVQVTEQNNTPEKLFGLLIDYAPDSICREIIKRYKSEITIINVKKTSSLANSAS